MKKNLGFFKSVLVLSLMIIILISTTNTAFADNNTLELELLKQENVKMRNELIRLKIKVQGKADTIPVLMYHHILTQKEINDHGWKGNLNIISLEDFKAQMDYLYQNDFHTLTLGEVEEYIYKGKELPKRSVVITFDDGYLSNAEYAYPVMKKYGFKATIFMIGKTCERDPVEFSPENISFLSNQERHKYIDVFEFGSHTYEMHSQVNGKTLFISSPQDKVTEDIKKNKELYKTSSIAYPHGDYNQDVINLLIKGDYKLGFTSNPGYVNKKSKPFELNRITIYPHTGIQKFKNIVNGKK